MAKKPKLLWTKDTITLKNKNTGKTLILKKKKGPVLPPKKGMKFV
jgi:hypothetical protein